MQGEAEEVELEDGGDLFEEEEAPARKQKKKAKAAKKRKTVEEEQEEEEELEPEEVAGLQVGPRKAFASAVQRMHVRRAAVLALAPTAAGVPFTGLIVRRGPVRALHGDTFGRRHPTP